MGVCHTKFFLLCCMLEKLPKKMLGENGSEGSGGDIRWIWEKSAVLGNIFIHLCLEMRIQSLEV